MKYILSSIFLVIISTTDCYPQKKIIKDLYYFQDSSQFVYCGTIISVGLFHFVSDTSKNRIKDSDFLLAMVCPESFGADSFKKNQLYKVEITKDYSSISGHMSPSILKLYKRHKNFYVVNSVEPKL